jgi:hypothetical protein
VFFWSSFISGLFAIVNRVRLWTQRLKELTAAEGVAGARCHQISLVSLVLTWLYKYVSMLREKADALFIGFGLTLTPLSGLQ